MESRRKRIRQHLGSFLKNQSESNIEIYFKTGIDPTRISKLSNPEKDTITAVEFFLIALATKVDLNVIANYVFSEYRLVSIDNPSSHPKLTAFGKFLNEGLILQKTVSFRTGIKASKLSALANDEDSIPMAKDVFLTALALNKKADEAFKYICGDVHLKSEPEQNRLRLKYKEALAESKKLRSKV